MDNRCIGDRTLRFSNYFHVDPELIERYGAIDVSLVNDLPLFIDPFLLFGSSSPELQMVHQKMIDYLLFLKHESELTPTPTAGQLKAWCMFPEVKQTWLGFSQSGNSGRGLGADFAKQLHSAFRTSLRDFGEEKILESAHMEKITLLQPNIGKDKISDFTTNFAKEYLLEYTEKFTLEHIDRSHTKEFFVNKVSFDYTMKRWLPKKYILPAFNNDYVLLTPRSLLTRDSTFINHADMIDCVHQYSETIGNEALRFSFNEYINQVFRDAKLKNKEKRRMISEYISNHPEIINYYLQYKESNVEQAKAISKSDVREVEDLFLAIPSHLSSILSTTTDFYQEPDTSIASARAKVLYLKRAIEDQDVYKLLWVNSEEPTKEINIQLLFRLVWMGSSFDLNREVNNGRGPVDYKVSKGSEDTALVEFKLASNRKLKQNLEKQVDIYKAANATPHAITVIVFFTEQEEKKVKNTLNELGLNGNDSIITIDARRDNKPSASIAR